ncbi:MAG: serine/threonine protein kinase [Deltaproteobacteria bacterium]|nr:serine/threonine protein kinase [Deltaproteobacteria bacterium]
MADEFEAHWFGKYELLRLIGVGGMAEVFLARTSRAEGFEKVVVVKRLLPRLAKDQRFVDMFLGEAKVAAKLQHANVVQILALEVHEGRPFIVMEYVHGKDLFDLLRKIKKESATLPIDFGIYCLSEMLRGLGYAHQAVGSDGKQLNLIHRDVTPSNIFISYDGDVKLGDFGVAQSTDKLQAGEVRGKFSYLAPEVIQGKDVDQRSDLFSAGVVLWETLAQRRLFKGQNNNEVLDQICNKTPEPPSWHNPGVPKDLDEIAAKALERDRSERFQSAQEFEDALTEWLFEHKVRWTRRRIAEVMKQHYPEESTPLVLPPPSVPSVMGALVEKNDFERSDSGVLVGSLVADKSEPTPAVPPGTPVSQVTNPWAESLESHVIEIDEAELQRQVLAAEFQRSEQLIVYQAGAAGPVSMPLDQVLQLLSEQPQNVVGLGVVGDWRLRRDELARLLYWDTLSNPPQLPMRPTNEGVFEQISLTRLIYEITVRRMSGMVLIDQARGSGYRIICLEGGYPIYIYSNRPQDGAPLLIYKRQMLSNAMLYRSIVQVIGDRIPIDQALIQVTGGVNQQAVERTFSTIVRSRLYEAFYWTEGRFRIYTDHASPLRLTMRVPPLLGILVRAVRRAWSTEELQNALYMKGLRMVVLAKGRDPYLKALRLKTDEQVVVEAIDGKCNLPQIFNRVAKNDEAMHAALATIYVLAETHLIELV